MRLTISLYYFDGLDWSLLVKHLAIEDVIKSCVYLEFFSMFSNEITAQVIESVIVT